MPNKQTKTNTEAKLHGRGTARCTTWAPPTAYVKKEVGEPGVNAARCSQDGKRSNAQFSDWVFDLSPSRELETYRLLWRRKIFGATSEPCKHGKTDAKR